MILEENYMIVISDIMMPGISGIELLKRVKEYNGMIQVIMMTGVVTIENVLACLRNGANECLLKPLDLEKTKTAVDDAIGRLERWENLIKSMIKRRSAGCSSGEEPYSLAFTLEEHFGSGGPPFPSHYPRFGAFPSPVYGFYRPCLVVNAARPHAFL